MALISSPYDPADPKGQPGASSELKFRHLEALQVVAEEGSFSRAAERLGYTQSAVSQQIAALERAVGLPLFDRPGGPRPVRPTRAGELLLEHAGAVLARWAAATADMAAYREGDAGRIAIGTFQSVAVRALPPVVGQLRRELPGLRIELVEHDETTLLLQALLAGDLDAAFLIGEPPAEVAVDHVVLGQDPFMLMSPAAEALAAPLEPVDVSLLHGLPTVAQVANTCQALVDRHLGSIGVSPDVIFRTGDNSAVQAMVRSGGCHAVMPRLTMDLDDPDVSVHELVPAVPARTITLATASGRHVAPAVERFVEIAVAECSALLGEVGGTERARR